MCFFFLPATFLVCVFKITPLIYLNLWWHQTGLNIYFIYKQHGIYCIKKNSRFSLGEILITKFIYPGVLNINAHDPESFFFIFFP